MACGKPIVAFSNTGYKEVLKGKGVNFLVKPKDIEGLEKKLLKLIKSKNLREEMGGWGLKEAQKYSWDKIAIETLNFYEKVLKLKTK